MSYRQFIQTKSLIILAWVCLATLQEWIIWGHPHHISTECSRMGQHGWIGILFILYLELNQLCARFFYHVSKQNWSKLIPWIFMGVWGGWLGQELAQGDWIQSQPWVSWIPWGLGSGFALGGLVLGRMAQVQHGRLIATTFALLSIFFNILDLNLLLGLYPSIHLTLYLLSALCALLSLQSYLSKLSIHQPYFKAFSLSATLALTLLCASYAWLQLQGSPHQRTSLSFATPRANLLPTWSTPDTSLSTLQEALKSLVDSNSAMYLSEQNAERKSDEFASTHPLSKKHVILIVVDTLRYDGIYQPLLPAQTTQKHALASAEDLPFITQWRTQDAHVFLNAYTQAGRTKFSTPALFTSSEVSQRHHSRGLHIAERFNRAGYQSLALTPEYFLWPIKNGASHLLHPFERSWHYTEDQQHHALTAWKELLHQRDQNRPLFAWVHFYMMHSPYFAGTKRLSPRDGSAQERYRRALKTLDQHLKELVTELQNQNMLEHTIIALTSDHGEGLGDHGADGHGSGVFEEQSHTPLFIYDSRLKSSPQRVHHEVVGNVDIVPTLTHLAGLPPHYGDEGHSLLPLLSRDQTPPIWPYPYVLANGNASERGLITQERLKLTYYPKRSLLSLYDLKHDPLETNSIAGQEPTLLNQISSVFALYLPHIALSKRLKENQPEAWDKQRQLGLHLIEELFQSPQKLSITTKRILMKFAQDLQAPSIYQALADRSTPEERAWIGLKALQIDQILAQQLLKTSLSSLQNIDELSEQLMAISAYRPGIFGQDWLTELLLRHDPEFKSPTLWLAWLTLSHTWPYQTKDLDPYQALIARQEHEPTSSLLNRAILNRFAHIQGQLFLKKHPQLLHSLLGLLQATLTLDRFELKTDHSEKTENPTQQIIQTSKPLDPTFEFYSTRAALRLSIEIATLLPPNLRHQIHQTCRHILQKDPRAHLKKSAIETLRVLAVSTEEKSEVIQILIEHSKDRLILVPIIDALAKLPSQETTNFLTHISRSAQTGYARTSAKNALKRQRSRKQNRRQSRPTPRRSNTKQNSLNSKRKTKKINQVKRNKKTRTRRLNPKNAPPKKTLP